MDLGHSWGLELEAWGSGYRYVKLLLLHHMTEHKNQQRPYNKSMTAVDNLYVGPVESGVPENQ
jgi:hypothetical protein